MLNSESTHPGYKVYNMKVVFSLALFNLILVSSSYCAENFNNDQNLQNIMNANENIVLGRRPREENDQNVDGRAVRRRLNNNPGVHQEVIMMDIENENNPIQANIENF